MMTKEQSDCFKEGLVNFKDLKKAITNRCAIYNYASISQIQVANYESEGWEIDRKFKNRYRMKKPKPYDIAFEDEVWTVFAKLGFNSLNKDRFFRIPYSNDFTLTQQIDVFAIDNETAIIVECKAAQGEPKRGNFKETIEAIGGKKEGIIRFLRDWFPATKLKVKFILATKNYIITGPDEERLKNFGILHFDEEVIQYYHDLSKHLGLAARYQLLGNLFEGLNIPELDNRIPAIQGKMGGHTYYSFSIEPEKLLKIGYVLHRNKANKKFMPTYQRLIKKSRLQSVQHFVEHGGFFPNSVVININAKNLQFDKSQLQVDTTLSKIGILHIPRTYRSAYIIDGQHRLYGYANSKYKDSNSIPVVAFVDLDRKQQVSLFMQINENQKAVPKNLRNTLNSDLLWGSENLLDQIKALKLQIAQDLGEEKSSPLFDRVIVGENPKTLRRCITIDTIKLGLDRSNFFGVLSRDSIKQDGTFYKGNNEETYEALFPFLIESLQYIKENLPEQWNQGEKDNGFLTINAGIESLIRIINDIVDHLVLTKKINPKSDKTIDIIDELKYYLDPMIEYLQNLNPDQQMSLRKSYGTGGRAKYWRTLQKVIYECRNDFQPEGMLKYWRDEAQIFNEESFKIIRNIEIYMKDTFRNRLQKYYGEDWFKKGVPKSVYDDANKLASDKNYEAKNKSEEVSPWDCLNIIDYRKIAVYGKNWSEIFEEEFTRPGDEKIRGGKEAKTEWMFRLERIRNQNFHSYSVKEEEYQFLIKLYDWFIEKS